MTRGPLQRWGGPANVSTFDIAVVVLVARSNSIEDLRPLAPRILEVIEAAARGRVTLVGD
jgi:hypothetical protein